jgi:YhcH/YjgK/YiaL family protein
MAISGSLSTVREQAPKTPLFGKAFQYIGELLTPGTDANRRILAVKAGESSRIELADGMFAMEQAYLTKSPSEGRWESHLKYIDIQVVIEGQEYIGVTEVSKLKVTENLTPAKDLLFYAPHGLASNLHLTAGEAAILYPSDGHLPGLIAGSQVQVRKSVVKVPVA